MPLLVVRRQSRIICEDRFSNQAAAVRRVSGGDLPLADSAKATRTRIEPRRAIRLTGESLASRALLVNTSGAESTFRDAQADAARHRGFAMNREITDLSEDYHPNFSAGLSCAGSSKISSNFLAQNTRSRFAPLTSLTMPRFANCPMARVAVL